jgi:hypothetical protein
MDCETLRDDRLDFLYGEADSATRQRVLEHLAGCEACREEVNGFRQLRQDLRSWTLPEGRGPSFVAPRRGSFWLPLAAGFVLALGAGLLLQGTEWRSEGGGFSVRIGGVGGSDPSLQRNVADREARFIAQEARDRRDIDALKTALAAGPVHDEPALLARVAALIRESELRQGQQFEARLARLDQKQEAQRRYDMARIAAGLSYLDGKNGQHVARTTELMGYVLDAAAQQR